MNVVWTCASWLKGFMYVTLHLILPPEGPHQLQNSRETAKQVLHHFCMLPTGFISRCDPDVYLGFTVVYLGSKISYETGKEFFI